MPELKAGDFCLDLKTAGEILKIKKSYALRKVKALIKRGEIKGSFVPGKNSKSRAKWCVSFRSVERYRTSHKRVKDYRFK